MESDATAPVLDIVQEIRAQLAAGAGIEEPLLQKLLALISLAGFDPNSIVRRKGITSAENHFLRHRNEWPQDTTLQDYLESGQRAAQSATGVMLSLYLGELQITLFTPSGEMRGIDGGPWIMLEYRISIGHWVTLHQPGSTIREIESNPRRSEVQWLRRPEEVT